MLKKYLPPVLVLLLFAIPVQSQKIFKVQYESQADVKIYIVNYWCPGKKVRWFENHPT